jgi:short-subunit dehydrogenase
MTREGEGRTALITGASAGIGKALAEVFAANGFDLILTARRESRLRALGAELEGKHRIKAHVFQADLGDPIAPLNLCQAFAARGLKVDALVNNAGYGVPGAYASSPWETHRDFLQVLVHAPCELAHRLLPPMQAQGYGRILNVASVAGLMPGSAGGTLYAAAKAAMIKFSQSLHLENETKGVHVTALCPGFTWSEFHDVTGSREQVNALPGYWWLTADYVAECAYRAVVRNKAIEVPGLFYKALVQLPKILPDSWGLAIMRSQSKRFRDAE